MPIQFTTDSAPRHQKLALWRDIVCDVFVQLDCKSDAGAAFRGAVSRSMLGPVACTEVASSPQRVFRTASRIARSDEDFILIALGKHGCGAVLQDDREAVIHPGEFAFYDTTRPYQLRFDADFAQTIFQVPRSALQRRIPGIETLTAVSFDRKRPLARLTHDFLMAISGTVDQLDDVDGARVSDQALDLLAMAMCERLGGNGISASTHRSAVLFRLKAHIRAHLSEPELSLATTAAALGISPRYVNDLLADEQTSFQRHVLIQRLEQCKRDLASPVHARRHIGEIAFAWGFNDLSHFGRAFREQFGLSPRDWRQTQSER
jgi:AraC-like DNA-binding protein